MKFITTILLLFVSFISFSQHKTYRNDILVCGSIQYTKNYYYSGAGEDFMAKYGLNAGDTIAIKQGVNGEDTLFNIDMGLASLHDLTFINDSSNTKQIKIGWFGLGNNAYNIKFLGNGAKGIYYGFNLFDTAHFGLSWGCVGNLEAAYFDVNNCRYAVQVITTFDHTYPVNFQSAYLHNIIGTSGHEFFYLGYVQNSPIAMDLRIDSIHILRSGWDGIQTRNTHNVLITNCVLDSIGMEGRDGDNHAFLFGGNSNGGTIQNCKVKYVTGIGIWNGGWGDFDYENNDLQAATMGIMSRSSFPEGDVQNTGRQHQVIKNNKITSVKSIECYYTATGKSITVDAENNCISGTVNIDPLINPININNTPCLNVLPVILSSFYAQKLNGAVVLKWVCDASKIEVERSADGRIWTNLGEGILNKYVDMKPMSGKNYYRLKMFDTDGKISYSNIIMVNMGMKEKARIYNVMGEPINDFNIAPHGIYFIQHETYNEKIIK